MISRRRFVQNAGVLGLGLLAGCGRLPWQAAPAQTPRIGLLGIGVGLDAVRQGLRDYGYFDGQNVTLEVRDAPVDSLQLETFASELVHLPVGVIVTGSTPAMLAASRATSAVPIVSINGDPVREGLAASYARPGGNVTGFSRLAVGLAGKRLELLKAISPTAATFAVLWNGTNAAKVAEFEEARAAAETLGVRLHSLDVRSPREISAAFGDAARECAEGLMVLVEPLTIGQVPEIVSLAAQYGLPTISERREFVAAGSLMAYGPNVWGTSARAAYYVDRILKGTPPAELPIERPTTFDFIINLRTAQTLELTIPQHVLLQATEVIQ